MSARTEEFAGKVTAQLHEALDRVPIPDVSWVDASARFRADARQSRRRRLVVAAAGLAAAAVAAVAALVGTAGGPARHPAGPGEPAWQIAATARFGGPNSSPARLAVGGGALFAGLWDSGRLLRLDPHTLHVTGRLQVGTARNGPLSIAYGDAAVWVLDFADARLWRVDPVTMQPTMKVTLARGQASQVAFADGAVWVTTCCTSTVTASRQILLRIDPGTGEVTGSVVVPGNGEDVTLAVGRAVAVASQNGPVLLVDPRSMAVTRRIHLACDSCEGPPGLALAGNSLYVTSISNVQRYDVSTGRFEAQSPPVALSQPATSLTAGLAGLWVATDGGLLLLEPSTLTRTGQVALHAPAQLVQAGDVAYASYGGGIARLVSR